MEIKGQICETGGRKLESGRYINEDSLTTFLAKYEENEYTFVIVMDGATGLGKDHPIEEGYTSAEWYVKYMMNVMHETFTQNPRCDLEFVVENAILKAAEEIIKYENENNIILEEYQKPSAGLSLLRTNGIMTEVYLIGDTQAIVAYKNGDVSELNNPNQRALQKLDGNVISRMVELAKEKGYNVLDARNEDEIQEMLRINRSKKNSGCDDGYWVCGTTEGTAKHGVYIELLNDDIAGVLLASDGFDLSTLEVDLNEAHKIILEKGVEQVRNVIREKQEEDPYCNKFPRFKKCDDLTAIYLDYLI